MSFPCAPDVLALGTMSIIVSESKVNSDMSAETAMLKNTTPLCPSALKEDKFKYQMQTNVSLCLAQRSFDSFHMLPK